MPTYRYKAVSKTGRNTKGIIEADNESHAARELRNRGVYPVGIFSLGATHVKTNFAFPKLFRRIPKSIFASTIRQLATLLNAGLPLEICLNTMIEQSENSPMRSILSQVRDKIREGAGLATAFADFPHIFSPTFLSMIKAAESAGTLESVMERLANHAEQQIALSRKVQGALAYPALMLIVGISVVVFLLTFVLPKVTQIFLDLDRALPTPTQILLNISDMLRYNWMYLVSTAGVLCVTFNHFIKTSYGKKLHHSQVLHIPVAGNLIRLLIVGRACRTLGMLLKNGVPLVESLSIVRNVTGNVILEQSIVDMNKGVQEGKSLAEFMKQSSVFPTTAVQMVAAGEKSGQLSQMLLIVANDCDNQVTTKLQMLTSLMEPVMILILGALVGFIVLAIILPIFEMSSLVG